MTAAEAVIFPLDEVWQVDARGYSSELSYQMVWLSGLVPFAQAQQILDEVGQIQIGGSTLWEQIQRHGQRLQQTQLKQQTQVSVERTRWQHER